MLFLFSVHKNTKNSSKNNKQEQKAFPYQSGIKQ